MKLTVLSPSATLVDKQVEAVTVPGGAGSFTILRNHAAILSTLAAGKVEYTGGELEIAGGIVHAADNNVQIFI